MSESASVAKVEEKPEEPKAEVPEAEEPKAVVPKSSEQTTTEPKAPEPKTVKDAAPSKPETPAKEFPKKGERKGSLMRKTEATPQPRVSHQGSLSSLSKKLVPITSIQIMEAGTGQEIFKVKVRKYLPTYRLESQNPFNVERAMIVTKSVVEDSLEGASYDPKDSLGYIKIIGREIRKKLKRENYDRYRIIVFIVLGQKKMQGIQSRSYAIWDAEKDSQCHYLFENMTMFCSVSVYGVYQD